MPRKRTVGSSVSWAVALSTLAAALDAASGAAAVLAKAPPHPRPATTARTSSPILFSSPVTLPLSCPQHICKYGGSTAADGFQSWAINRASEVAGYEGLADVNESSNDSANWVLGVVNRSVVFSSDSGATWLAMAPAHSREGAAGSAVGPGMLFDCGPGRICSTGNARLGNGSAAAVGDTLSIWTVGVAVTPTVPRHSSAAADDSAYASAAAAAAPAIHTASAQSQQTDTASPAALASLALPQHGHSTAPATAPNRTIVRAPGLVRWVMPDAGVYDTCMLSGYSGQVVSAPGGGELLKTMILWRNCSKPAPPGWGTLGNADIHLFASDMAAQAGTDGSRTWRWRGLVAAGNATGGEEGANENDMVVTSDGALLVVFRVDGGDGFPHHRHRPYMKVRSVDNGKTWSKPVTLPPTVLSARPQMLMLTSKGPLLLTGGRPKLMLWLSADGTGDDWTDYNIAAVHNAGIANDSPLRYCAAFANGTAGWLESTCYNSLQRVADDPTNGSPRAVLCYDRMGTEPPAAPPQCQPAEVNTFCMQITLGTLNATASQITVAGGPSRAAGASPASRHDPSSLDTNYML